MKVGALSIRRVKQPDYSKIMGMVKNPILSLLMSESKMDEIINYAE